MSDAAWRSYKSRFITDKGRVVDTGNNRMSHSEGQGYGMLLAVAADDRDAFQRIWDWTRGNLMVRNDSLFAWRWEPDKRPGVADMHDASDGDILIAWALAEAAEAWSEPSYKFMARRIAVDVGRRVVLFKIDRPPLLLPGMSGFSAEDRSDGPVINLSYWVFPAFGRLAGVAPDIDWDGLAQSGLDLVHEARFGSAKLPSEWISMHELEPVSAPGFQPVFSYNSIRIPLYLVWAGITDQKYLEPYVTLWKKRERAGLQVVDTSNGLTIDWLKEPGYSSIAELLDCAESGAALPTSFTTPAESENYYPATLHLLSIIAAHMRYPSCLGQ